MLSYCRCCLLRRVLVGEIGLGVVSTELSVILQNSTDWLLALSNGNIISLLLATYLHSQGSKSEELCPSVGIPEPGHWGPCTVASHSSADAVLSVLGGCRNCLWTSSIPLSYPKPNVSSFSFLIAFQKYPWTFHSCLIQGGHLREGSQRRVKIDREISHDQRRLKYFTLEIMTSWAHG